MQFRKKLVHVARFGALAVVPVLALNSFATADTGGATGVRPGLTQAQRDWLTAPGVPHSFRSFEPFEPFGGFDPRTWRGVDGQI